MLQSPFPMIRIAATVLALALMTACTTPDTPPATVTQPPQPITTEVPPVLDANSLGTARAEAIEALNANATATAMMPSASRTPTRTPDPSQTPTLTPSATPTNIPFDNPDLEIIYGRGIRSSEAIARLGMGYTRTRALSPDGKYLAIGTTVGIYVFESASLVQLWAVSVRSPVEQIEWSPDSQYVAVRLFEWGNILIWEANSGALVERLENNNEVASFAWSPDGTRLAVGLGSFSLDDLYESIDGFAIWDFRSGTQLGLYPNTSVQDPLGVHPASDIKWLPDGKRIVVITGYFSFAAIDASTGEYLQEFIQPRSGHGEVLSLKVSPEGTRLISYTGISGPGDAPGGDSSAYVWDIATGELLFTLAHDFWVVTNAVWSPDSRTIITSTPRRELYQHTDHAVMSIWDAATGRLINSIVDPPATGGEALWSADGQTFITQDSVGQILLWNRDDGDYVQMGYQFRDLERYTPDHFVSYYRPLGLLIWDAQTGTPRRVLTSPVGSGRPIWSPDGERLAIVPYINAETSDIEQSPVFFWDPFAPFVDTQVHTLSEIESWHTLQFPNLENWVCNLQWDRQLEVSRLYDREREREIVFDVDPIDDSYRARLDATISVNTSSGHLLHSFHEEDSVPCSAALSPDGSLLAVGHEPEGRGVWQPSVIKTDDAYVTVYDIEAGTLIHKFLGHTGLVYSLTFSPDGNYLATSSADGTTLIWDINRAGDQ